MLKLDRSEGQKIFIDNGRIHITVLRVVDDIITLGIHAPLNIDIAREEVFCKNTAQEKLLSLSRGAR